MEEEYRKRVEKILLKGEYRINGLLIPVIREEIMGIVNDALDDTTRT